MEQRQSDMNVELNALNTNIDIPATEQTVGATTVHAATRRHYAPQTEVERILDKSINLKCDLCVVLILAFDGFLQRMNASSIAYIPKESDMVRQTGLKSDDIDDAQQLFLAAFITLSAPLTVLGRVCGLRNYLAALMACSGALSISHAAINGSTTLFSLRVSLGVVQSGFLPSTWSYIAGVYPKHYLGFRMALFAGLHSFLVSFIGIMSFGMLKIVSKTMQNWQVMFLIIGSVTILFAFSTLLMLPRRVSEAWFLSPMERKHAVRRMILDTGSSFDQLGSTVLRPNDFVEVARDWRKLSIVVFNCLVGVPDGALGAFLPMVLHEMRFTGIDVHLMGVIPFVTGFVELLVIGKLSDRWRERSFWIAASGCITTIGLVTFLASTNAVARYICIHICAGGAVLVDPLVAAWLAGNTPIGAQRSIILGINGMAEVSSVISGQIFNDRYSPVYRFPLGISLLLLGISLGGFLLVRLSYTRLNAARMEETKSWTRNRIDQEMTEDRIRGDHARTYLYGY